MRSLCFGTCYSLIISLSFTMNREKFVSDCILLAANGSHHGKGAIHRDGSNDETINTLHMEHVENAKQGGAVLMRRWIHSAPIKMVLTCWLMKMQKTLSWVFALVYRQMQTMSNSLSVVWWSSQRWDDDAVHSFQTQFVVAMQKQNPFHAENDIHVLRNVIAHFFQ